MSETGVLCKTLIAWSAVNCGNPELSEVLGPPCKV